MKSSILFIGYEPSFNDEIREFMKERQGVAYFSSSAIETIRLMDVLEFDKVVLNLRRLEDAAILRYINLNYQKIRVLVMPSRQLQDAIPALASGHYELLHEPLMLEELRQKLSASS